MAYVPFTLNYQRAHIQEAWQRKIIQKGGKRHPSFHLSLIFRNAKNRLKTITLHIFIPIEIEIGCLLLCCFFCPCLFLFSKAQPVSFYLMVCVPETAPEAHSYFSLFCLIWLVGTGKARSLVEAVISEQVLQHFGDQRTQRSEEGTPAAAGSSLIWNLLLSFYISPTHLRSSRPPSKQRCV